MAYAKKCDVCGDFFSINYSSKYRLEEYRERKKDYYEIDLCPNCVITLSQWINKERNKREIK